MESQRPDVPLVEAVYLQEQLQLEIAHELRP